LAVLDGGTGASTAANARINLGLVIGTDVQAYDADLAAIVALTPTDSNIIVGNGSAWVAESGATARTSLGLGTGDSPQFAAVNLGHATDTTLTRVSAGLISVEGVTVTLNTATQTLTNKTISADNNTISGIAASSFVLSNASGNLDGAAAQKAIPAGVVVGTTDTQTLTNKTLTLPVIAQISNTGVLTLPTITDTLVGKVTFDVLANKILTYPVIDYIVSGVHMGTLSLPAGTDTIVARNSTDTLTNKTLTAPTIGSFTNATHNHQAAAGGGTLDHGLALTGLTADDHTQYLLATGARTGASSSSQTFTTGVIDSSLTASRLMASDGSKKLASVADLTSWIAGTANRVTVTSDGDGTVTLSGPQDIHTGASPTFVRATLSQATGTAPLTVSSTTVVSNLNADKADGYDFDQDVRTTGVPQFARLGLGKAAHGTYKLDVLGDSQFDGHIEAESADFNAAVNVYQGDLRVFGYDAAQLPTLVVDNTNPLLYVDVSKMSIGINCDPDIQFSLDVDGALRADWLIGPHAIQLSDAVAIMHFDGPGPYETNYTGTSQTHKGDVATLAGSVIYRPGKFQKAVQVAEATTNRILNPSCETNVTGYDSDSAGHTKVQSNEQAYSFYLPK
jgi:hypothetical protein